jgi:hypothetical protein
MEESSPNWFESFAIMDGKLSEIEIRVVEFLVHNFESKLKDFFLADLSWANNQEERNRAFVDFFTKRKGKRVLDILPEDIRNYILANSL